MFLIQLDSSASEAKPAAQPTDSTPHHVFTPQGVQFSRVGKMVLYKSVKPPRPITFASMPPNAKTTNRYYFYGWHFTPAWMRNLVKGQPGIRSILDGKWTATDGVLYIAKYTGYLHVHVMGGMVEPDDDTVYEGATWEDGKQSIDIISIFVNHRNFRHRQPTKEQMERLMHIFGREPQWFQDYNPPSEFASYAVQDLTSVLIAKGD